MKRHAHRDQQPVDQTAFYEVGTPALSAPYSGGKTQSEGQQPFASRVGRSNKLTGKGPGRRNRRPGKTRLKGLTGGRRSGFLSPGQVLMWAFLLPVLVLIASYLMVGIFPFWGEKTSLTIDLYHQYAPFLAHLRDKLLSGGSLFYDWNIGLGTNFLALAAYYLGSPLNLLLVLFPPAFTSDAVIILTLLKVGLCGLTFACFLRGAYCHWGAASLTTAELDRPVQKRNTATHFALVLTASFYALSGFVITFAWNIMWLDGVALLPLVMLGMHRLIREGKFLLYTLSLAAALLINYYIALFICLFTVPAYFVVYFSLSPYLKRHRANPWQHFLTRSGQMLLFTFLAVAISALMTLPTYISLTATSAVNDQFPEVWSARFSLFEFMGRHMVGVAPSIRDGLPNIYAGVLTAVLLPLYAVARHIRLQERLLHMAFLAFLFLSFNVNGLDFIWHGLHYPNQLPYRYSFVYSFLLLTMIFRLLLGLRQLKKGAVAVAVGIGLAYAVLAEVIKPEDFEHATVYLTLAILLLYFFFFLSFLRGRESLHRTAALIGIICVAELCINSLMSLSTIDNKEYFTRRVDFNNDVQVLRQAVSDLEKKDPEFWRMEMVQQKTTNSPALYNYRGFTIFSSTSSEGAAKLMRTLGFHGNNINSYKYTASTAPLNALFNIRYLLNKDESMSDPLLTEVARAGENGYIYRQEGAISAGFGAPASLAGWQGDKSNPFTNQNNLYRAAGAGRDLLVPLDLTINSAAGAGVGSGTALDGYTVTRPAGQTELTFTANLTVTQDQHVYFHFDPDEEADFELSYHKANQKQTEQVQPVEPGSAETAAGEATGEQITTVNINDQEMVDAGFRQAGDVIRLRVTAKEDGATQVKMAAAGLDLEAYRQAVELWKLSALTVEQFTDNHLSGQFQMPQEGYLFLSIPYDRSWQIKVDGEPVEAVSLDGGLTLVPAGAGQHSLEMTFVPPYFYLGAAVSASGLLLLLLLALCRYQIGKKEKYRLTDDLDLEALRFEQINGVPTPPPLPVGVKPKTGEQGRAGRSEETVSAEQSAISPERAAGFAEVGRPQASAAILPAELEPFGGLKDWDLQQEEAGPAKSGWTGLAAKSRPAWQRALTSELKSAGELKSTGKPEPAPGEAASVTRTAGAADCFTSPDPQENPAASDQPE